VVLEVVVVDVVEVAAVVVGLAVGLVYREGRLIMNFQSQTTKQLVFRVDVETVLMYFFDFDKFCNN